MRSTRRISILPLSHRSTTRCTRAYIPNINYLHGRLSWSRYGSLTPNYHPRDGSTNACWSESDQSLGGLDSQYAEYRWMGRRGFYPKHRVGLLLIRLEAS